MSPSRNDEQIDPISAASAGMLAIGVKADKRAHALGLLAEMLDRADRRGVVRFDGEMMRMEERLGVHECLDSYSWLEATGVAKRTHVGWQIPAIRAHRGPVGVTASSMAILARHLEANAAEAGIDRDITSKMPMPVSLGANAEIAPIAAARADRDARALSRRLPVMAGSIAAAAAAVLGLISFANDSGSGDHRGDLASRSGSLTTDGSAAGGGSAAGLSTPTAPTVGGVTASIPSSNSPVAAASGSKAPPCLLPDIKVLAVDFTFVPDVLTGPTWTALVAGTITNVSSQAATLDGVRVLVDLGNGAVAEGAGLLPPGELAPGQTGTFSALVPLGADKPEIAAPTVTATNWKSTGC
ncbi:MAG TPA: hypothetical protein VNB24_07390 [Acidimicrobiales bacterium]|nr:hypothetical protein [Acidimicrobiales bacterium]